MFYSKVVNKKTLFSSQLLLPLLGGAGSGTGGTVPGCSPEQGSCRGCWGSCRSWGSRCRQSWQPAPNSVTSLGSGLNLARCCPAGTAGLQLQPCVTCQPPEEDAPWAHLGPVCELQTANTNPVGKKSRTGGKTSPWCGKAAGVPCRQWLRKPKAHCSCATCGCPSLTHP